MMVPAMQLTQVALDVASVELDDFPAMHKHKRKTVSTLMHRLRVLGEGACGGGLAHDVVPAGQDPEHEAAPVEPSKRPGRDKDE